MRITIELPEDLKEVIEKEANYNGLSVESFATMSLTKSMRYVQADKKDEEEMSEMMKQKRENRQKNEQMSQEILNLGIASVMGAVAKWFEKDTPKPAKSDSDNAEEIK